MEQMGGFLTVIHGAPTRFQGLTQIESGTQNHAVAVFERLTRLFGDTAPLHAANVHAKEAGRLAVYHSKGRNVLSHLGHAADHGQSADAHKLMNAAHAAEYRLIFDFHVAAQADRVGNHDLVTQDAVVSHMGVGHDQVVVAQLGDGAFVGSPMNCDILADDVAASDDDAGFFAVVA